MKIDIKGFKNTLEKEAKELQKEKRKHALAELKLNQMSANLQKNKEKLDMRRKQAEKQANDKLMARISKMKTSGRFGV